jgi:hypothetical protein
VDASERLGTNEIRKLIAEDLLQAEKGILYFATQCKTLDEHEKNRARKVKYYPVHKEYIRPLLWKIHTSPRLVIYKSRQLLVTWSFCVDILHNALFGIGENIGIVSIKEETAGKVIGKIKFIYDHLPEHWRFGLPEIQTYRGKKGIIVKLTVLHSQYSDEPDSIIQAAPKGSEQLVSETFSRIYWDEVKVMTSEDAELTYNHMLPTIEGGGRLGMSSTPPRDPEHFFNRLVTGKIFGDM